jgi:hypothetical protein
MPRRRDPDEAGFVRSEKCRGAGTWGPLDAPLKLSWGWAGAVTTCFVGAFCARLPHVSPSFRVGCWT